MRNATHKDALAVKWRIVARGRRNRPTERGRFMFAPIESAGERAKKRAVNCIVPVQDPRASSATIAR